MMDEALSASGPDSGSGDSKMFRLPKKSIQQEYLMTLLFDKRDFTGVLKDLKRLDDPRPQILARQIINGILDDDIKLEMLKRFDAILKQIADSDQDADAKAMDVIKASQDAVGAVNSYLDEFFALHKGQEIGDV
jgi:hypothetical protein